MPRFAHGRCFLALLLALALKSWTFAPSRGWQPCRATGDLEYFEVYSKELRNEGGMTIDYHFFCWDVTVLQTFFGENSNNM
jgi:hypothetical protein